MNEVHILSTPIEFPFKPYPQELEYMKLLIQALHEKKNCALEAETGFGKSVCLFCSALSYQKQFRKCLQLLSKLKIYLGQNSLNRCLEIVSKEEGTPIDVLHECVAFIKQNSQLRYCLRADVAEELVGAPPQVLFLSRTHTELQQASACIRSIGYLNVNTAYLGARAHFCLNETVKELSRKSKISIATICKSFVKNRKCEFGSQGTQQSQDLEDLLVQGMAEQNCPYFSQRNSVSADIILAPYQYLFDRQIVENAKNAIIIVDEAHNFEEQLKQQISYKFSVGSITTALRQMQTAKSVCDELGASLGGPPRQGGAKDGGASDGGSDSARFYAQKASNIAQCIQILQRVQSNCKSLMRFQSPERAFSMDSVFDGIQFDHMLPELCDIGSYCDYLVYNLQFDYKRHKSSAGFLFRPENAIWKQYEYNIVPELFKLLEIGLQVSSRHAQLSDYCVLFDALGEDHMVQIECLNVDVAVRSVGLLQPYALVLTSATLSPLQHLEIETGLSFCTKASLPSIIRKGQLSVTVLDDERLVGTFVNRTPEYYAYVLREVELAVRETKSGGILAFVPSYGFLKELQKLQRPQGAFFEGEKDAFTHFKRQLTSKPVLFAVARGSFAEGIDFADELCRTVIMVSIPFADVKSRLLRAQQAWYDQHGNGLNGQLYYENMAFRTVNQCIGRVIRHRDDHGRIILMDQRYTQKRSLERLPEWIRQEIEIVTTQQYAQTSEYAQEPEGAMEVPNVVVQQQAERVEKQKLTRQNLKYFVIVQQRKCEANDAQFKELIRRIKELGKYQQLKQACKSLDVNVVKSACQIIELFNELNEILPVEEMYIFLANLDSRVLEEVVARLE